jgi:hypothetical protein
MSYSLLTSLYYGEGSNADLTSRAAREMLHLPTRLESLIPDALGRGLDVVLTGNPGDGKSHLVRTLAERDALAGADHVLDLSARPTDTVLKQWATARRARRRFVLCGNEGPLGELLNAAATHAQLRDAAAELQVQLRHLVSDDALTFPPPPTSALLIDLADRSVLDEALVDAALRKVSAEEFLPDLGALSTDSSAGRNLMMLQHAEVRRRLARVLVLAGRLSGEHVTFRQLWGAIAYAVSAAKALGTLRQELSRDDAGLGATLFDNLVSPRAMGLLLDGAREHVDPACVPSPDLDEQLWANGEPDGGRWLFDVAVPEPPAALWARGDTVGALQTQAQLKRAAALMHERGDALISALTSSAALPSASKDADLLRDAMLGLRRLYLAPEDEGAAPPWLLDAVPIWLGFSYEGTLVEERPHVAVRALPETDFELRRPVRAPWLGDALGPLPEVAWLRHRTACVTLRIEPRLLAELRIAATTSGPMRIPEPVQRFLVRLAGWDEETTSRPSEEPMAVIARPRGRLIAAARVAQGAGGARYV